MSSVWDELDRYLDSPSSITTPSEQKGSITAKASFDAKSDVQAVRKAIEGIGTTEGTLIDILTQRSNAQRQQISKAYQEATGRSLVADLKGDLSGSFENLLVGLVMPPAVYDAKEIIRAIKGAGTTDSTLIEIFASRNNQQIRQLSDAYESETKRKLLDDLKQEVSGDYGKCLLILAEGKRDETTNVDDAKAKADAKALYEAGEKKWGTDESKFIEILCRRSIPQLRKTLVEYKSVSGKTLQQSIEGEMSGSLEDLLVAVVKCVKNVPAYFAERLYKSMKGAGTDEDTLTRIMVCRSEIDMLEIRTEFKKLYGTSLHSFIQSDTSGDYGTALLKVCRGDD
ncbi:annexin A3a isoform X1 [Amia ocellicauda]|uniref:annexin A3a isoform X1 n=1 Tax=Amia ocellicauda TaxID=2972642 RepID=UPI0034645D38